MAEESNKAKLNEVIDELQNNTEENQETVTENKLLLSETISDFKKIAKTYIEIAKLNKSAAKAYNSSDYTTVKPENIPEEKTIQQIEKSTPQLKPLSEISSMMMQLIKTNNEKHDRLYKLFNDQYRQEDIRRRENEAEKSKKTSKTTKSKSSKGFSKATNFLKNILQTAFLGKEGTSLLKSLIPKSFDKDFGLVLVRSIAGALIGPEFLKAIQASMAADGLENKIIAFFDELFTGEKTVLESIGIGALTGLAALGPSGIIIGGILAGVYNAFSSYFSSSNMTEDDKEALKKKIKDFIFGDAGAMAVGALVGFKAFGLPGLIIGTGVVAAGSIMSTFMENYEKSNEKTDSGKLKEAALKTLKDKPKLSGFLLGGTLGGLIGTAIGGPVGGVAGAIIGAGVGAVAGIVANKILSKAEGEDGKIDSTKIKSAVLTLMKENPKFATIIATTTAGGLLGAFGGGPMGAIAGAILGAGVGLIAGPLVDQILKTDAMTTGSGKLSDAVVEVMKKNPTLRRISLGAATGGILGAISGGPVGMIAGAIIGASIGYMVDLVDKDLLARKESNKKAGSNTPMLDAILQSINENPEIAKWGSSVIGAAVGTAVAGPVGLVAGAFLGYAFGKVSEMVAGVFARQQQNSNESILKSIANELLKTPISGLAATGALIGAGAGLFLGPGGVLVGMVVGGVLGAAVGAIVKMLDNLGVFDYLGEMYEKFRKSVELAMEGEFSKAYEVMKGNLAYTEEGIKKLIDEGNIDDAIRSLALVATNIPEELKDKLENVNREVSDIKTEEAEFISNNPKINFQRFKEFLKVKNIDIGDLDKKQRLEVLNQYSQESGLSERLNGNFFDERTRQATREKKQLLFFMNNILSPMSKLVSDQQDVFGQLSNYLGDSNLQNIDISTAEGQKILVERFFRSIQQIPPTVENNSKGSYVKTPILTTVGEKGPEMILNQEQIYGVTREILTQRYENEILKMSAGQIPMPPPAIPNVVDNKKVSIQETFNVTEILPMPSSHFSLMDAA